MQVQRDSRQTGPMDRIDREAYEPAYAQLVNILRHHVADGIFRPGDQLPSEAQLCQRYQVSPMTVRRAINILADQGVVSTAQGRGTFVKPIQLGAATFDLRALQDLFSDEGTAVRILEARIVSAGPRAARKLTLPAGARTIYIRRLILRDEAPILYHREYLVYDPTRPVVEAELEVTALQGLFDGAGQTGLKRGDLSIKATTLDAAEAEHLQGEADSAALCLEHLFYDFEDRPISWGWFVARGDRLRFATNVGIQD